MKKGIVKWFNATKGFGFIEAEGVDYFVHFKSIQSVENYKTLDQGQIVMFETAKGDKGMMAINVKPVEADGNAI